MSKFKKGDKVKNVSDKGEDITIGNTYTLTGIGDNYILFDDDVGYPRQRHPKKYELITPSKREFKVGDKVRQIKHQQPNENGDKGICEVTDIQKGEIKHRHLLEKMAVWLDEDSFELIPNEYTREYKAEFVNSEVSKKMEIEDMKKANVKEAKKQCVDEAKNNEITEAKVQYNNAVNERDRLDRDISALVGLKKKQQEILDKFTSS